MKKTIVFGVVALLIAVVGVLVAFGGSFKQPIVTTVKMYCSSDGKLTTTQLIQSHRSYCIKPEPTGGGYIQNTPVAYGFSIVDDEGNTLKDFNITHTKQLHLIVASKDLAYFQHVHPELDKATGVFTMSGLTFPVNGPYRIFADFAAAGGQVDARGTPLMVTPSQDVVVGDEKSYTSAPLGAEDKVKTFDGYQVTLGTDKPLQVGAEGMITFDILQDGKKVTDLEPYLGALGHSVILREGTLDFIHAHPIEDVSAKQNGTVKFMVSFPEAGKYKIFTQFQRGGKVVTTDFVVSVSQGPGGSNSMEGQATQEMTH